MRHWVEITNENKRTRKTDFKHAVEDKVGNKWFNLGRGLAVFLCEIRSIMISSVLVVV